MDALNLRALVQWSVSQHHPRSEQEGGLGGAGRKLGQQRGSAAALNDYTGLNLLGRRQTGSGRLSDSERQKNVSGGSANPAV